MRKLIPRVLAAISALLILTDASAQSSKSSWKAEWDKTVEAARQEGKVVVSIPASAELRKRMEEVFPKRFGVALELFPARGSESVRRIVEEFKAGVRYFDVHMGGTSSIVKGPLQEAILEPIQPWMILPEVKDPENWWGGHIWADSERRYIYVFTAYLTETLWYNTELVRPQEISSYDHLLDPKWKGKIAILDPRTPGSGESTWGFLWKMKGEDYLRRLVAQDLIIGRNQRQLAETLAKGKAALTIGLSYYTFLPYLKAGLPLKPLPHPKEGIYASSGSGNLVVIRNAPHPNAAKVYMNWLLSQEGQEIFGRAMGQATRRLDVDTAWTREFGHTAAKEVLTRERYYELENQSEEKINKVREPAAAFARKLLD